MTLFGKQEAINVSRKQGRRNFASVYYRSVGTGGRSDELS